MQIIVDSREQHGYTFSRFTDIEIVRGALPSGDYSLGPVNGPLSTMIAVERKSLQDFIGSISGDRERFLNELTRLRGYEAALLIVEAPFSVLAAGRYRSKMSPTAAVQTVFSLMANFRLPIVFCNDRNAGEDACYSFLRHYARHFTKRYKCAAEALGDVKA